MTLDPAFLGRPIAHRAMHWTGHPENSRAAIHAAIEAGYGIEIDLQCSVDGVAMVFHDYSLERLTAESGPVAMRTAAELRAIPLSGGDEGIPTFAEVLEIVGGRVPLLVEIKDQDGALGANVGPLEEAVARDSAGYSGPIAFMCFNPNSMIALKRAAPATVRGLATSAFSREIWGRVPAARRSFLAAIPDESLVATGASFISHRAADLEMPRVADLREQGVPVLCWTIRSADEEARARKLSDNITFEGYTPGQT